MGLEIVKLESKERVSCEDLLRDTLENVDSDHLIILSIQDRKLNSKDPRRESVAVGMTGQFSTSRLVGWLEMAKKQILEEDE